METNSNEWFWDIFGDEDTAEVVDFVVAPEDDSGW